MRKLQALLIAGAFAATAFAVDVGPDSYGYTGTEIDFVWEDISTTGTEIMLGDDDHMFLPGALSFGFPFYGQTFYDIAIESNGTLIFQDQYITLSNYPMPNTGYPLYGRPALAPFWDDLDPANGDQSASHVYYQDFGDRFIVQFTDVPHYPDGNMEYNTFQTVLYANGHVEMRYMELTQDASDGGWGATIGIQGTDGVNPTDGLTWAYNNDGPNMPASQTAILWIPEPASLSLLGLGALALLRRR